MYKMGNTEYDFFISGPFFNLQQYEIIDDVNKHLEKQYPAAKIWLPMRDAKIGFNKETDGNIEDYICRRNYDAFNKSARMLCFMDMANIDLGTVAELGVARALEAGGLVVQIFGYNFKEEEWTKTEETSENKKFWNLMLPRHIYPYESFFKRVDEENDCWANILTFKEKLLIQTATIPE